jgi:hypothetical protein
VSFSRIGAVAIITFGVGASLIILLCLGYMFGWNPTWQSLGVTPLPPPFFDTHVVIDYADCASKGIDPYRPHACNPANFNVPPIWLWIGVIAVGKNAAWFSCGMIAVATATIIALFKGRPPIDGVIALIAILSPSVLMGVERGNPDLLIFAITGAAALIYDEQRIGRNTCALFLTTLAMILKLFPMFTAALVIRGNRRDGLYAILISALSLIYLIAIFRYILLIRSNVPTTFILSYGYKSIFLGLDYLRTEAGLPVFGLADTWAPILLTALALICATAGALFNVHSHRVSCKVATNLAGTAFIFGSSIYCGTFLLGTNFIYRLTFLLLCLPQLQDWCRQESEMNRPIMCWLLITVLAVLWLNGDANGHTTFLIVPQLFDWLLFSELATVLISNALDNIPFIARLAVQPRGA